MRAVAARIGFTLRHSVAAQALVLIAMIALVQVALIARVVVSQRDGAHIIDVNGSQRMRTQKIAYLALSARSGLGEPGWRAELHATVAEMLAVRHELLARTELSPSVPDRAESTMIGDSVLQYAEAGRALERDPHDAAAFDLIATRRLPLTIAIDETVKARAAIIDRRNTELLDALLVGLCATFIAMGTVWFRVIAPSERRTREIVARLNNSEAEMRSLFMENPDSIAMYDRDGRVLRGNRASCALLELTGSGLIGEHFARHVTRDEAAPTATAFARALAGECVTFDTTFWSSRDESIDVNATLFPNIVDGRTVGVIGVAKDTRALHRAEAAYAAQRERITELYRASAYQNRSWKRQVDETLAVAAQRLGYEWAMAAEIVDGVARAVAIVGDLDVDLGGALDLAPALVRRASAATDVWSIDDIAASPLRDEATIRAKAWGSLAGVPLAVGEATYGSLLLGSRLPCTQQLDDADRDFLRLVTALVAASIQRGHQEEKLDALAFFDALTGLPNRVLLADRMSQSLAAAARRNRTFAVHCLDLDRFKAINDGYGHATGDEVLRIAAHRMKSCTREEDTVARTGGDEFVILQALDPSGRGAEELATRLLTALERPFHVAGIAHVLSCSIGISLYPGGGIDQTSLLRSADAALLRAKLAGRNRLELAT